MLTFLLLLVIYLAFISLGLPDAILGVSIPDLQEEMGMPLSFGGLISLVMVVGTIFSSFISHYVIAKIGTGRIAFLSSLLTGLSILGFSLVPNFYWFLVLAIPLGLGAGTVDVALNNYVAQHFKAHHMNWLHSFWGLGATLGPIIMSFSLAEATWRQGFSTIAGIQLLLALVLLLSLPLWKRHQPAVPEEPDNALEPNTKLLQIPGLPYALAVFFLYCAVELATGLWGSSYLVAIKGFDVDQAASYIALYYVGITGGRFLAGFISFKLSNTAMLRLGIYCALLGAIAVGLLQQPYLIAVGVVLIGLGFAPIYPAMIHDTPKRFGKKLAQKVLSYQMGFAYIGTAVAPPALGLLYESTSLAYYPIAILLLLILLWFSFEKLERVVNKKKPILDY